jgi:hypothetical protein
VPRGGVLKAGTAKIRQAVVGVARSARFLLFLVFFLVAPGPEGFDDQSQLRALLATDMPP